jgi:AbrB family looped-hinge helix DNA binding protein
MALMKALSRIDEKGRITIPSNIRKEAGLREGDLIEIKGQGTRQAQINIKRVRRSIVNLKK